MNVSGHESDLPPAVAIVVAGGKGLRMGGDVPKQYRLLAGVPVLARTLLAFEEAASVLGVILVIPEADREGLFRETCGSHVFQKLIALRPGGATRQESVRNGLAAVDETVGIVLIHDGVRPLVTVELIDRSVREAWRLGAVIPGIPVTDTLKTVGPDSRVTGTLNREGLWLVQTPQAFRRNIIVDAYEQALRDGFTGTDDAVLTERTGVSVTMIPGSPDNLKITLEEDLQRAEVLLAQRACTERET